MQTKIIAKKTTSFVAPKGYMPFPEGKLAPRIDRELPGTRKIRKAYWNPKSKVVLVLWNPDQKIDFVTLLKGH
jgi:hypothetical protein